MLRSLVFPLLLAGCLGTDPSPGPGVGVAEQEATEEAAQDRLVQQTGVSIRPVGGAEMIPTSLVLRVSQPMFSDAQVGKAPPSGTVFRLRPEQPGALVVTGADELTFTPEGGFAPATNYVAALESLSASDEGAPQVPDNPQAWVRSFESPPFKLVRMSLRERDQRRQRVVAELVFSGPVDVDEVVARTRFSLGDSPISPRQTRRADSDTGVQFVFTGKELFQDVRLKAHVEAGAALVTDASIKAPAGSVDVALAAGAAVKVHAANLKEGSNGFYIDIVCDDEAVEAKRYYWDRETYDSWYVSNRCLLDADSAASGIHFTPAVEFTVAEGPAGFRIFGDFVRGAQQLSIDPGTLTVDGGLLDSEYKAAFTVPARSPAVRFAAKGRYLPRDAWDNLAFTHVNLDAVEVTVRHIPEENLVFWMGGEELADPRTSNVVVKKRVPVRQKPDAEVTTWLDVDDLVPRAAKGVYEIKLRGLQKETEQPVVEVETQDTGWVRHDVTPTEQGPTDFSRLLLTDLQIVAKLAAPGPDQDWTPEARVWALDTHEGTPVSGVEIKVVRASGQALGSCRTDGGGGCAVPLKQDADDPSVPIALLARKGDDLTYLRFEDLKVVAPGDTQGAPYLDSAPYRAAVYADRGVFRPGDTAHVSAIVRQADHLAPPPNLPVVAKLFDPRGKELRKRVLRTNAGGMVSVDLPFADYASTGSYRVSIEVGEVSVGDLTFNVEEFVPERMKVDATVTGEWLATDSVPVDVAARWLFGGSAEGSGVELECELVPGAFAPPQNQGFHYGLADLEGEARQKVALGMINGSLGEGGTTTLACPAAARSGGFLGAAELVARAAVQEGDSGRTTLGTARAQVHPERYYLGLGSKVEKARGGQELAVEGVIVDWTGQIVDGPSEVRIDLYRLEEEYSYTWTDGRSHYQRTLRRAREDTVTAPTSKGRFGVSVNPSRDAAGFLVVATQGNARTELFVEGTGRRYWWQSSEAVVDQTPRPARPGELVITAPESIGASDEIVVTTTAPYRGRMLFTAETHKVLDYRWMEVEPGPVQWRVKLDEFVPNVYVSALLVKDPHLESDQAYMPDRAFGVRSIQVKPQEFTHSLVLSVPDEVRPYSDLTVGIDLGPQDEVTYVTVAAVDEGILSLTDFQSPDPFKSIFARRQLGVQTFETIGWTLLQQPGGPSSSTGGDGDSSGGGRVQMVKPVALWSGIVEVPRSGKGSLTLPVPGYRGELRVMAVAAGTKRMGHAAETVTVRDPIVLQTTLPRFLTEGDEAVIPVFVANVSGAARQVLVELAVEDLQTASESVLEQVGAAPVSPVSVIGSSKATVRLADGASDSVLFRVRADRAPDAARFKITATADNLRSLEELELPIQRAEPEIRETRRVALVQGSNDLGPALQGWVPGTDRTRVWITSNPYGEALSHVRHVVRYPYGCIEQTTSSTRPLLYVGRILDVLDPELAAESPVDDMVKHGIERVISMQTPSGGFAYWPGSSRPNRWGTVYATHMLLDAKEAGFHVPQESLDAALTYLEHEADGIVSTSSSDDSAGYLHFVLAKAGRARVAQAESLLSNLSDVSDRDRYRAMAEPRYLLMAAMYLGGDRRYEAELRKPDTSDLTNKRRNDWTFWSDLRYRAFALSVYFDLFGATGAEGEKLATLVGNGLARQSSRWYNTQEIGWGLTALGKWVGSGMGDLPAPELSIAGKPQRARDVAAKGEHVWAFAGAAGFPVQVDLKRTGGKSVFAMVSTTGIAAAGAPAGGQGLSVSRTLLDGNGAPINPDAHDLGDAVYVRLQLRNTSGYTVQNIALVDRIPAGWEIENPRLGRGGLPEWFGDSLWTVEHMNLRDDRVEVFGSLESGETQYVIYQVRAVTGGTFTHPGVTAEAMYDPGVWVRTASETVRVRDPWSGS